VIDLVSYSLLMNHVGYKMKVFILPALLLLAILPEGEVYALQDRADSLRAVIDRSDTSDDLLPAYLELAEIKMNAREVAEFRELIDQAMSIAISSGNDLDKFSVLYLLSEYYLHREQPDSVLIKLEEAEALDIGPVEKVKLYNFQGAALIRKSQPRAALTIFEKAEVMADSLGELHRLAAIRMNMATVYSDIGNHPRALELFYNGLQFSEEHGHRDYEATVLNNIGNLFINMGRYEDALEYLEAAEKVSLDINNRINLRRVYTNYANAYTYLNEFDRAQSYYDMLLAEAEQNQDLVMIIRTRYNLGNLAKTRGNLDDAEEILESVYEEAGEHGILPGMLHSLVGLGEISRMKGADERAILYLLEAFEVAEVVGIYNAMESISHDLYQIYRGQNNFADALNWLETNNEIVDRNRSEESAMRLAEYETLFDIRSSEQEAELLRAREQEAQALLQSQRTWFYFIVSIGFVLLIVALVLIWSNRRVNQALVKLKDTNSELEQASRTIRLKNNELQHINGVKDKLFTVIAHDLRSPLASLQSMIYLMKEHELTQSERDQVFKSLDKQIQDNLSMMDNLLGWAKAQMNGIQVNYRTFDLSDAVHAVVQQLQHQAEQKNLNLIVRISPGLAVRADYDMIKLVFRNLVANGIKFCEAGGEIRIEAVQKDQVAEVRVTDDGIGIRDEDKGKLFTPENFTTHGTDNEAGSGLGLNLSKEFVEKLGGKIWFESEFRAGTTFFFTIPLANVSPDDKARTVKADELDG
jgi:two-component system, sensor histidine kinase and response regulator